MRKEALIAVLIGLTFGGLITYGIYTANKSATPPSKNATNTPALTPTPSLSADSFFQLTSPEDGDVFATPSANFTGTLKSGFYLIISTDTDDLVVSPSTNGAFSQSVRLTSGDNPIKLTALNFDGQKQETTLHLVYSTAKIKSN